MIALGTIVIRDVLGLTCVLKSQTHDQFMEYRGALGSPGSILVVDGEVHTLLNTRHIVSIEWQGSK